MEKGQGLGANVLTKASEDKEPKTEVDAKEAGGGSWNKFGLKRNPPLCPLELQEERGGEEGGSAV